MHVKTWMAIGVAVVTFAIIPILSVVYQGMQGVNLDTAIQGLLNQGYVAYADPQGTLHTKDVIPVTGNTYSIGQSGTKFKDGYFSGTVTTGAVTATNATFTNEPSIKGGTFIPIINEPVVVASNAPTIQKTMANFARLFLGDWVQVCDGTADQTEINTATALSVKSIMLSSGTFSTNSSVTLHSGQRLHGQGLGTVLQTTSATTADAIVADNGGSEMSIEDMHITGSAPTGQATGHGLAFDSVLYMHLSNVSIADFPQPGIYGTGTGNQVYFQDVDMGGGPATYANSGVYLTSASGYMSNFWIEFTGGAAIDLESCTNMVVTNVYAHNNGYTSNVPTIKLYDSSKNSLSNIKTDVSFGAALSIQGTSTVNTVTGFNISNSGQGTNNTYNSIEFLDTANTNVLTGITTKTTTTPFPKYDVSEASGCYANSISSGSFTGAATTPVISASSSPINIGSRFNGVVHSQGDRAILSAIYGLGLSPAVFYPLNELTGTTISDYSVNGRTATASQSVSAFNLNKAFLNDLPLLGFGHTNNDYVSIASDTWQQGGNGTNDNAVTFIFTANVVGGFDQTVVSKWLASGSQRAWQVAFDSTNHLAFTVNDESAVARPNRTSTSAVSVGSPIVYAVTYSGAGGATAMNGATLYQNGAVVASTATNDAGYVAMESSTAVFEISGVNAATANAYSGQLGAFCMIPTACTQAQVLAITNAMRAAGGF